MDTMGARERLEAVIEASGAKTKKEFARKTGVSESTISQITSTSPNSRQSEISEETAKKIVASLPELRLSMVWLVSGKGEMRTQMPGGQPSLFTGVTNAPEVIDDGSKPEPSGLDGFGAIPSAGAYSEAPHAAESLAKEEATGYGERSQTQYSPPTPKSPKSRLERIVMFYSDGTFVEYRPKE